MNEMVLGVMMLVASTTGSATVGASRTTIVPAAFTFELPGDATMSRNPGPGFRKERPPQLWRSDPSLPAQPTGPKRFNKVERILGVAAGAFGGFWGGGALGYYVTQCKQCDDDGTSGLKGMVIGAPIGAVVGAILGYRWTR
jgi:hypothetical protein